VPSLWPIERLFFECYARGAQGEPPFDRLVPALVEQTLAAVSTRADVSANDEGRAGARLGLASSGGFCSISSRPAIGRRPTARSNSMRRWSRIGRRPASLGIAPPDVAATRRQETTFAQTLTASGVCVNGIHAAILLICHSQPKPENVRTQWDPD
jgi:hypothetical protein